LKENQWNGVWVPALTPFNPDLSVNHEAFIYHCRWLIEQGAEGLAVFGTTSEASSLSMGERKVLLEALVAAGIPPRRLMPGVGCTALPDTLALCRHALAQGCQAVLMLPPFYYKGVGDNGLFAAFSWIIEQLASEAIRVFLYHIPPVTGIPISLSLIEALRGAYPRRIAGVKDSGGDWTHTQALLRRFPGMAIFAGSERFLLDTLREGGAGCITASGNVNPGGIRLVQEHWEAGAAGTEATQGRVTALRDRLERFTLIPALKALCARHYDDDSWRLVRPPLMPLTEPEQAQLRQTMDRFGFSMSRNRESMLEE